MVALSRLSSLFSLSIAGDRAKRQRIESKAENKALIPVLCSLQMAEGGLHGNDTRQTSYDSYVLLPEALNEKNIFANSFAVRRRATQQDADFLPMSEYLCNVTEPGRPTAPPNLSLEKRAAMLFGGESVPSAVIQALLHNQTLKPIINGHNDVVVLHHFTPLDGGLELSVLRRNLAGPMQFRCCSIGLDAESAKLAQNKLVRCVLLDWKENTNKLLAPQAITFVAELPSHDQQRFSTPPLPSGFSIMSINPETNKPEFTLTMRKKWSEDPVYGPA